MLLIICNDTKIQSTHPQTPLVDDEGSPVTPEQYAHLVLQNALSKVKARA